MAAALAASPARAENDERRAIMLFEKGRKLAREGRCAEAIEPLLESIRYAEGVGPLLNLGHCYELLGKTASAHRFFLRAEEVALARDDTQRRNEAMQRARAIEKDVSTLVIHVPRSMRSPDAQVLLDGEVLPSDRWGAPVPVDPGEHEIEVVAPPHPKHSASVTVGPKGDRVEWTASPPPARPSADVRAPAAALAPSPGDRSAPASSEPWPQRTIGLVTGGVGIAGIAAGAVLGVISISAHSTVTGACPTYPTCSVRDRDMLEEMNGRAAITGTASTISFVAGAVLLAGGAALFLTAPPAR